MEQGKTEKVTVIGIGRAGVNIINALSKLKPAARLELAVVDTDKETLDSCDVSRKILADSGWRKGSGCGGSVIKGQRSLARERSSIRSLIEGSKLLIVTGGFGGGTGTGGVPIIASVVSEVKIPAIFMMTLPFSFEGHSRLRTADDGVRELLPAAEVLLCLPNDLLFSALEADAPARDAFAKADMEMARAVLGMSEIIRSEKMLPADFASFRDALNNKKATCCFGIGTANATDGLNRGHIALEKMLKSPFMGSADQLKHAHAVMLILTGGADMKLGELKKILEAAEAFASPGAKITVGVNTDPSYEDTVQLTAVAITFDKADIPIVEPAQDNLFVPNMVNHARDRSEPGKPSDLFQDELPLQSISKGVFVNSTSFIYNGEDLDIPTFQRKMITIDKGEG